MNDGEKSGGIGRRGALDCMVWAGTGVLWTVERRRAALARPGRRGRGRADVRLHLPADQRQPYRLQQARQPGRARHTCSEAVARIGALPQKPDFMIHTGDISHLSQADRSSTTPTRSSAAPGCRCSTCPASTTARRRHRPGLPRPLRQGARRAPAGTASTTAACTSSGLVNVVDLKAGGLGNLGARPARLARRRTCAGRSSSTPIVVFAHIPLWTVYRRLGLGHGRRRPGAGLSASASARSRC